MCAMRTNQIEHERLRGLPLMARCLYYEISWRRDFATGLTGARKGAGISWQAFQEWLSVDPHPGLPNTGTPHKSTVRRAIVWLEKAGLIRCRSVGKRLIFECLLADKDNYTQKQADTKPTHKTNTKHSEIIPFRKSTYANNKPYNDTHTTSQVDIPPGSGIDRQLDRRSTVGEDADSGENQVPGLGKAIQMLIDGGVRGSIATSTDHRLRLKDLLDAGATRGDLTEALSKARMAKQGKPFSVFYLAPIIEQQIQARKHPRGTSHGARKPKLSAEDLAIQQLGGGRVYEHEG